MSQPKGSRKTRGCRFNKKINIGDKGKEIVESIDENNPVIQQFRTYASELNDKHDRFERILKHNRDITIESKRIICLLHTIDKRSKQENVFHETKIKVQNLTENYFKCIALELENQDTYQYFKVYRSSLEEYIEAITFYHYLQHGSLENWMEIQKMLTYTISKESKVKTLQVLVTPYEYILGIADMSGELMRKCINNLATGDIASCYQTCNFVRNMYKGFLSCSNILNREINRKLCVLKQNLQKMENVCYTIKVRGSEIPKHILVDVATEEDAESDEGYQGY